MNTTNTFRANHKKRFSIKLSGILFIALLLFNINASSAQARINWDAAYGGSDNDLLQCQQQTSDGGYILGGTSTSPASGDKSKDSKGQEDFWIIKVDASGKKQWDKTFGGSGKDFLQTVQQTLDGGYILGGYSNSPVSGDKSDVAAAEYDFWVIKINASGKKQWDKTFGGKRNDFLISIALTSDKGYILGGTSNSPASGKLGMNKSISSRKEKDYWIVKINSRGQKEWDRTIGGSSFDYLRVVKQTRDKGFIIGGYSYSPSSGHKTGTNKGLGDYWIVKLNAFGLIEWNKTIGGRNEDLLETLEVTKDGGYILGGTSSSSVGGNKTQKSHGETDYWLVKLDKTGTIIWDKTFGGSRKDNLRSVKQTSDGGYIVGGFSTSPVSGNKSEKSNKDIDFWVLKLNAAGSLLWDKTIGGNQEDGLQTVQQVRPGEYVLGGYSLSSATEDKTASSKGNYDYWLVNISVNEESASNYSGAYTLNVKTDGNGTVVNSNPADYYPSGSVVSLKAKPAPGYKFTGWSGDVNVFQNPLTITINSNKKVKAIFDPIGQNVYEAENAFFIKGALVQNEHRDYRGKGYVDIKSKSYAIISWLLADQKPGDCELTFRYSNGSGTAYPLKIIVNGEIIAEAKSFKTTETWSTWSDVTVKAKLRPGLNEIRLKSGEKGGPNIDYLRIKNLTTSTGTEIAAANSVANQSEKLAGTISFASELLIYPNPVPQSATLTFALKQDEAYELSIHNLDGTLVQAFPPGLAQANQEVRVTWNANSVKSGIYLAKLKTKSGVQNLRLIKN